MIRRLLIVDDDVSLVRILSAALTEEEFVVEAAYDGATALRMVESNRPELVILDVLLPEIDGLSVCRRIRARGPTPIILLSSRGEEIDRVTGIETGADDYVTKPFSTRELCARIRAIDRRMNGATPSTGASKEALTIGELHIDARRFLVRWRDQAIELTRSEFQVLLVLAQQRGFVLSRDRLLDLVRGSDVTTTDRTIDTFVKRIRKKIRDVDPGFDAIETVFGIGYRYK